jgi:hypothetical protein
MRTDLPYTVINVRPDVCYVPGHKPIVTLKSDQTIRLANTFKRFGVGSVPVGNKAFNERGIEQEGPWAFAFGLCTVIDNYPERRKAEYDADIIVSAGQILMIDAKCYKVTVVRGEFIQLDAVETPPLPVRHATHSLDIANGKHLYEVSVKRDLCGNLPWVKGQQFDLLTVRVGANSRTQAASKVKREGWSPADVNMIG